MHPGRDPGAPPDQVLALRRAVQRDHDPFLGLPRRPDAVPGPVVGQLLLHAVGQPEQRQLPQRAQVARPEVVVQRDVDPVRRVDLALRHPGAQRLRAQVHQFDPVGGAHHLVRDPLPLGDTGDLLDDVAEALQVLDVERRRHIDPRRQQLPDILPALGVPAAGHIAVRQLVHQRERRPTRQQTVEVQLAQLDAAVPHRAAGQYRQVPQLLLGAAPAVGLGDAHHDVQPLAPQPPALGEHGVRLPDPRRRPQEDPQPACHVPLATSVRSMLLLLGRAVAQRWPNRRAVALHPFPGSTVEQLAEGARLASLADGTPEGCSVVELTNRRYWTQRVVEQSRVQPALDSAGPGRCTKGQTSRPCRMDAARNRGPLNSGTYDPSLSRRNTLPSRAEGRS